MPTSAARKLDEPFCPTDSPAILSTTPLYPRLVQAGEPAPPPAASGDPLVHLIVRISRGEPLGAQEIADGLRAALGAAQPTDEPLPQRFLVKKGCQYVFVRPPEIDFIQSADNYVEISSGGRKFLLRETMASIEGKLDPQRFLRIRQSAIVNLDRVEAIRPWSGSEFQFVLSDGTELVSARSFRQRIRTRLFL